MHSSTSHLNVGTIYMNRWVVSATKRAQDELRGGRVQAPTG